MKSENAIERRATVRSARLLERLLNLRATIAGLLAAQSIAVEEENQKEDVKQ